MAHPLDDLIETLPDGRSAPEFLVTKEHRRFAEFADACRRERYISVWCGPPGIGKTLSARHYSHWDTIGPWLIDAHWTVPDEPWDKLGLTLCADDFTDAEAIAAVARITAGNFRLVHRLFPQIQRVLDINELRTVTREVVEAARETLVIGA